MSSVTPVSGGEGRMGRARWRGGRRCHRRDRGLRRAGAVGLRFRERPFCPADEFHSARAQVPGLTARQRCTSSRKPALKRAGNSPPRAGSVPEAN